MIKYPSIMKIVSSVFVLHAMTACSEKALETPGINYAKSGPIMLNVETVQVVSIPDTHPSKNRHAQEEAKLLRAEIERWAHSRFSAQGGEDRAMITINKATLKVLKDSKEREVSRVSRDFYEGKVDIKFDILDSRGFVKGTVSSSIDQTVGIPETYTVHEREAQIKRLREELVNATDNKIVKEISQNLILYMVQ